MAGTLPDIISLVGSGGIGAGISWVVKHWIDRRHDDRKLDASQSHQMLEQALDRIQALEQADAERAHAMLQMAREIGASESKHLADESKIADLSQKLEGALERIGSLEQAIKGLRARNAYLWDTLEQIAQRPDEMERLIDEAMALRRDTGQAQ